MPPRPLCAPQTNPRLWLRAAALVACVAGLAVGVATVEADAQAPPLRIGLSGTLSREYPEAVTMIAVKPLRALINAQTRLNSDFTIVPDAHQLADQLANQQVKLGVFQGVEFAWARTKHPRLTPLIICVNQRQRLHAYLMVRQDCGADSFDDLKDQTLALVRGSREHCKVFCDHQCRTAGKEMKDYFGRVTTAANAEEALDQVVDGAVRAAIVDGVALDCYARGKPGRFAQLKELVKSDAFPATVIAYQRGTLDDLTLKRFREGLLGFKQAAGAQQAMMVFKMTSFESVPDDYEQTVAHVARKYPPPGSK